MVSTAQRRYLLSFVGWYAITLIVPLIPITQHFRDGREVHSLAILAVAYTKTYFNPTRTALVIAGQSFVATSVSLVIVNGFGLVSSARFSTRTLLLFVVAASLLTTLGLYNATGLFVICAAVMPVSGYWITSRFQEGAVR